MYDHTNIEEVRPQRLPERHYHSSPGRSAGRWSGSNSENIMRCCRHLAYEEANMTSLTPFCPTKGTSAPPAQRAPGFGRLDSGARKTHKDTDNFLSVGDMSG
jgi:hypothetical protein